MFFKQFFDQKLAQYSYLLGCQATGEALIIDPMRDIDQYLKAAADENLEITKAADTHIHADYVSGLREFAENGTKIYASDEGGKDWRYEWLIDSDYNYQLLKNGNIIVVGNVIVKAWHTPGHTPEHLSYYIIDRTVSDHPVGIATGDFVFVGDVGRPDLLESAAGQKGAMEPSAKTLYHSIKEFKKEPEYLQIWPGHGAGSACGKTLGAVPASTVGYELRFNPSILEASDEQNFIDYILEGQPAPPYYFARMKVVNKKGPKVLGILPNPSKVTVSDINDILQKQNIVILDTREMKIFMVGHLPGSICAPLNKQFNTVAGCYIEPEQYIYLVIENEKLDEAKRDLVRIGLDRITGFITPVVLDTFKNEFGKLRSISVIDFKELKELQISQNVQILDVRKKNEYEKGHIPDALNIAYTRLLLQKNELSNEKPWAVHCQTGIRSAYAVSYLETQGFSVRWVSDDFKNAEELFSVGKNQS